MTNGAAERWRRPVVADTAELRRIRDLPRRTWTEETLASLAREMTSVLKTPDGTMELRPVQALALHDIGTCGGLFAPIRVGGGKTLVSLLTPYVLEAQRPMLLMPASLIGKTQRELQTLSKHWRIPRNIRMHSYEMLGRVQAADTLEFYRPDLLILDEAHRAKNKRAGVTRRLVRYVRQHPEVRVVVMSGTMIKDSLKDFAHLLRWSLKHGAPVPASDGEVEEWADALDEKISNPWRRADPGALMTLAAPGDGGDDELSTARRAFRRRLVETPGVVSTAGESVNCSLYVRALPYAVNDVTERNFHILRSKWETPDGWALSEAVAVWRHARELALGMHYVWDPRPPQEWLMARRAWAQFVRETLSRSRTLDTELQVARAVQKGALEAPEFDVWMRMRPGFTPNPKALWHDDSALELCQDWMNKHPDGIVWVEHRFFAHELSRRTGAPYFGPKGLGPRGQFIEDAQGPIIASVAANATGRNLQHKWRTNLVTSCPSTALLHEQLIGRTHRDGQRGDDVTVDIMFGCWEHWNGFETARAAAKMSNDMLGDGAPLVLHSGNAPKLLIADVDWPSDVDVARMPGARWTKVVDKDRPANT